MDHQDLHKLVEPMPAWMHAVIKPKGGHINATVSHSEIHLHDVLFIVTFSFKLIIEHPSKICINISLQIPDFWSPFYIRLRTLLVCHFIYRLLIYY